MSRERRSISERKIRRIREPEDGTTTPRDVKKGTRRPSGLKPSAKNYYSKVAFGIGNGTIAGIAFLFFNLSPDLWLVLLIAGLVLCALFIRYVLKVPREEVDNKRLWLSGTFTFILLFVVVSSLFWMVPGPT
ncbi:MAG: hypothetical protein ACFFFG_10255 [Candidatus Thorarchaeota archaeon]